jgi:hypothetical protein
VSAALATVSPPEILAPETGAPFIMRLLKLQVNNRPRSAQASGGVGLETCRVPFGRAFQPAFFQAGTHAGRQARMPTPRASQAARFFAGLAGPWRAWREILGSAGEN